MDNPAMPSTINPAALWTAYGHHAELILGSGPRPIVHRGKGWFAALSGAPHVDLNQAAVFGPAESGDLDELVKVVRAGDVPTLLAVSSSVTSHRGLVSDRLSRSGFVSAAEVEYLFLAPDIPARFDGEFVVRRVDDDNGLGGIAQIVAESHGYATTLISEMWGSRLVARPDVGCWVAWDGDEPASMAVVTRVGDLLGVFDMMTSPRHRRRGAGRMTLTHALAAAAASAPQPIAATFFWSTPMGRPLYEAVGFGAVDTIEVWTLGASDQDMAAVGAGSMPDKSKE